MLFGGFKAIQPSVLMSLSGFCIILALYVLIVRIEPISKKRNLFRIELGVAVLLLADALCFVFEGYPGRLGYWMARITNFILFVSVNSCLNSVTTYAIYQFMSTGMFKRVPKRLYASLIVNSVGILMVAVSQFNGMYYSFDIEHNYHRGPLFLLSYAFPLLAICILFSFFMSARKLVSTRISASLLSFTILPAIAGIMQALTIGYSFISLAIAFCAILLFAFVLADQNIELNKAATVDGGTGLPNSYGYLNAVDRVIASGNITEYAGVYFDIARMGQINDRFGRDNGTIIIQKYARTIRKIMDDDEILGRLGGNFFVGLIKKKNQDSFIELLSDVPVDVEFDGRKSTVHVSAVVGVYPVNEKKLVPEKIIGYSSSAISYAKNVVHQPVVVWDDELEAEFREIRRIEEDAHKAIRNFEFLPYYQPKVNTETGIIYGAEALVRWKKDGKLIPPMQFVPILEKNGYVCDLDFYILEYVCRDIRSWLDSGYEPVVISVNFSRRNLGNPILAEAISKVVEKYNIPKKYIEIEITETIDQYPMSYLVGVVDALHRYGLRVAIDDFGTGSSSINLLKECKFDVLKIDRAFIEYRNEQEKILLENIIKMVHSIGLEVIAEGVETEEQVAALGEMGCINIQGFYFAKPMPKEEFEHRLIQ